MAARPVNIISFIGLVVLLIAGYGRINYHVHLILTCVLLVIFTSATIVDFLFNKTRNKIGVASSALTFALALLMACLTGAIIGGQLHDVHDGGPSFGMAGWPVVLNINYPISFSIFIFSLSYSRRRIIQLGILVAWAIATGIYGYYFDSHYTFTQDLRNSSMDYDSVYFPSQTKVVTPLVIGTVLFWTCWISIKWKMQSREGANMISGEN